MAGLGSPFSVQHDREKSGWGRESARLSKKEKKRRSKTERLVMSYLLRISRKKKALSINLESEERPAGRESQSTTPDRHSGRTHGDCDETRPANKKGRGEP